MERACKLANRAILKCVVSEAKQFRQKDSLLNSSTPVLYTQSRCVSSLSPSVFRSRGSKSENFLGRNLNLSRNFVGFGVGSSQTRSISVEALKPSDTFPRHHNSATPEEQSKMAQTCGFDTLESLIDATVPKSIRLGEMKFSKFDEGLTEGK